MPINKQIYINLVCEELKLDDYLFPNVAMQ